MCFMSGVEGEGSRSGSLRCRVLSGRDEGMTVLLTNPDQAKLHAAVALLGECAHGCAADVIDPASVGRLLESVQ